MKEILYIQAGSLANYVGTHFWNTQESYRESSADSDGLASEIDHDVSFREGVNHDGESTYCPRLLVFDHQANFGALSQSNALYGEDDNDRDHVLQNMAWSGNTIEYEREAILPSNYQVNLDLENSEDVSPAAQLRDIRYWSDFTRPYYVPRTVQKVPDVPEWEKESARGNWAAGHETFVRYDENTGLMEGPVRTFLEECDTIQGIQVVHETGSFGSFVHSLLSALHDEGTKIPVMTFPLLAEVGSLHNRHTLRLAINDALTLRGLGELSLLNVPIQHPAAWHLDIFESEYIHATRSHPYHMSAILSAHIESATLPLRLKASNHDIYSFAGQLCGGTAPLASLTGIFPLCSSLKMSQLPEHLYSLSPGSRPRLSEGTRSYSRHNVTRGLSQSAITAYDEAMLAKTIQWMLGPVISTHAGAYPLPNSFPAFFRPTDGLYRFHSSVAAVTSLSVTEQTPVFLDQYVKLLKKGRAVCIQAATDLGLEKDEMLELAADLQTLKDRFSAGDGSESDVVHNESDEE
ncbi:hypothetical protein MIND_01342600 [Mycena indigotica]|uniref:Tubulin nucleotide-binding domain-like protein n=1 Tax=Mycena indigotica TaxID=2126181 RepID=A0A8H6S0A1_9AGAR|nr:uncharacterized protein MIND_01342600 [Mycena indigotica]KAF7290286.1 hypothetical protein MIND_01342600 [Mycena indigotica]